MEDPQGPLAYLSGEQLHGPCARCSGSHSIRGRTTSIDHYQQHHLLLLHHLLPHATQASSSSSSPIECEASSSSSSSSSFGIKQSGTKNVMRRSVICRFVFGRQYAT